MKLRSLLLLIVAIMLGSCAKFPAGGVAAGSTRLSFRFTLSQAINPNYIYVVAIRVLDPPVSSDTQVADPNQGPSPVVDVGSKNGFVGGLPTHYVAYTEATPNLYQVFRFPLKSEANDPSDPAPINLAYPGQYVGDVLPGSGIDPRPTSGGGSYGNQLGFDINTTYLNQHSGTDPIRTIQFNIFTMNVRALTADQVNRRVMDAIGNQTNVVNPTFVNPIQINITTGGTYSDQNQGGLVAEQTGDTFPNGANLPAVDLTGWQLTVTTP